MRTRQILFITMFFLALTLNANHTKEVQEKVDHLKSVIEYSAEHSSTDKEKEYENYHVAVVELAKSTSSELVQQIIEQTKININDALIVMAHNIANKPELLNEILEYYKKPSYKNKTYTPKVVTPKYLNKKHCTEKYRHVWEYLLLSPKNAATDFLFRNNIGYPIKALGKVGESKGIPIITYTYDVMMVHNKSKSERYRYKYDFLISIMRNIDRESYLHYYLLSRRLYSTKLLKKSAFDLRELELNETSEELDSKRQKWKEVILAYPKVDLPQWQKEFLDDVLKAIDEQEKKDAKTTK